MENIYEQYAVLKAKIDELEVQKDGLIPQILQQMNEAHIEKVETGVGKFSITKLKKWSYSPKVEELADDLKTLKAREESTGEATYEEKDSLRFTGNKL